MFDSIQKHCDYLVKDFSSIPEIRKAILQKITKYIQDKLDNNLPVNLVYICTHNSRRSHFGQVWAAVAAKYYDFEYINTFSGGTEETVFNSNAINALSQIGFEVSAETKSDNPVYSVKFGISDQTECFSKVYDHPANPKDKFAAIMTCSDAEENCPFIPGAELRIGTNYDDPKEFDGTSQQEAKYSERSNQIALECLYVFSKINKK